MFQKIAGCLVVLSLLASSAAADTPPEKLIVATWNVEWFFDNYTGDNFQDLPKSQAAPSREAWDWKLAGVAKVISEIKPTILALQEIENQRVLFYLTRKLKQDYNLDYKVAYIEGADFFTEQDVAVLALSGLTEFSFRLQTNEMYESKDYYNVNKHISCQFEWGTGKDRERLKLINVHFRAMPEQTEIRTRQARLVRHWINDAIAAGENVMVLGDVNTEETYETTTKTGDIGKLRGLDTDTTADDLADLFEHYKGEPKETHLVHKQFDHILVTPTLVNDDPSRRDFAFQSIAIRRDLVIRGKQQDKDHMDIFWTIPEDERDVSDHYPVVAEFTYR